MLEFIVVCHTDGCGNAEAIIDVLCEDAEPIVICGVCSNTITDVKPKPAPKKK